MVVSYTNFMGNYNISYKRDNSVEVVSYINFIGNYNG